MKKTFLIGRVWVLSLLAVSTAPLNGAVVTVPISGTVNFASGTPFGVTTSAGASVSGTFIYDTAVMSSGVDPVGNTLYPQAIPGSLVINIGGDTFEASTYDLAVGDNVTGADRLEGISAGGWTVNGVADSAVRGGFEFRNNTLTALTSNLPPDPIPALADWLQTGGVGSSFVSGFIQDTDTFEVVRFDIIAIPEPSGAILLLVGLIAVGRLGRHH